MGGRGKDGKEGVGRESIAATACPIWCYYLCLPRPFKAAENADFSKNLP